MTLPRPLILATLPGRTAAACRAEAAVATEAGADLAEVRLDRWAGLEATEVGNLFPSPLPLIATYRSRREGGDGKGDPVFRSQLLTMLESFPFWAVDREAEVDGPGTPASKVGLIRSTHLPEGTAVEVVVSRLLDATGAPRFVKVVVPSNLTEALDLLNAVGPMAGSGGFVLHTTGGSGNLLRALARRLGLSAVYGALPEEEGGVPVEASQIPVDRLARYLADETPGPLFALLGASTARSRSPRMFGAWTRTMGDPGLYIRLDVRDSLELGRSVEELARWGFRGFNVTQPWKRAAFELADENGPGADVCGCANVLTVSSGGTIEAANTDLAALLQRIAELQRSGAWPGDDLLVLGTGGAARAALAAGRSVGAKTHLFGRSATSVTNLAREFGATPTFESGGGAVDVIVNATSMGLQSSGPPSLDVAPWVRRGALVLDFVYGADDPWIARLAHDRGAEYRGRSASPGVPGGGDLRHLARARDPGGAHRRGSRRVRLNGQGSAWAAISFVNALLTGTGAAAAISLSVRARVELTPAAGPVGALDIPVGSDTPLLRRGLLESLRRLEPEETFDVTIGIDSSIPVGRGLKSSSALGVAIYRAVASAVRKSVEPQDAARFSSELGRAVGVSATGAFDDAIASASGGFVVAETERTRILRHDAPDSDWRAVLWIPRTPHPPSPDWLDRFRGRSAEARAGVEAAKLGGYLVAMERNTELVEQLLGYDYRPLRRELRRQGALASGVSGMGPTLAAIARARDGPKVSRAMPVGGGEVRTVEFVAPGSLPPSEAIA